MEGAARGLGLTLQSDEIQDPNEINGTFAAMTTTQAEASRLLPNPLFLNTRRIIDLAARGRLPGMYPFKAATGAEGLMAYDENRSGIRRRTGFSVDRIFKGAKAGELPVEQPTKFELFINLKTAKALRLTIPPAIQIRADGVIQ